MIVHNLYVRGPRVRPAKGNSVSIIDSNAELAPSISGQALQAISRRNSELVEGLHRVHLIELASCDTPKTLRTRSSHSLSAAPVEDVLGCLGCEGPNHKHIIARLVCYCKSFQCCPSAAASSPSAACVCYDTPACPSLGKVRNLMTVSSPLAQFFRFASRSPWSPCSGWSNACWSSAQGRSEHRPQ